jgi:hypothetical protein
MNQRAGAPLVPVMQKPCAAFFLDHRPVSSICNLRSAAMICCRGRGRSRDAASPLRETMVGRSASMRSRQVRVRLAAAAAANNSAVAAGEAARGPSRSCGITASGR